LGTDDVHSRNHRGQHSERKIVVKHEVIDEKHGKKDGPEKTKLQSGLRKLSHEHLTELHHAVGGELERRAKEAADNKKPSEMSNKEFDAYVSKIMKEKD
jgi:hypothetical protein